VADQELGIKSILAETIPLLCEETPAGWDQWCKRLSTVQVSYTKRPPDDLAWYYRRVVDWAFGIMRQLPGSLHPIIPENVSDSAAAARAMDQAIHWCELQLSPPPPPESLPASAGPDRGQQAAPLEQTTRPAKRSAAERMTVAEANEKARQLARKGKKAFFDLSEREQARRIGCSWATWRKTDLYRDAKKKGRLLRQRSKPRAPGSPSVVSLTKGLEAVTAEGDRDEVLQQLIAEQEADDDTHPKTRIRRRL